MDPRRPVALIPPPSSLRPHPFWRIPKIHLQAMAGSRILMYEVGRCPNLNRLVEK